MMRHQQQGLRRRRIASTVLLLLALSVPKTIASPPPDPRQQQGESNSSNHAAEMVSEYEQNQQQHQERAENPQEQGKQQAADTVHQQEHHQVIYYDDGMMDDDDDIHDPYWDLEMQGAVDDPLHQQEAKDKTDADDVGGNVQTEREAIVSGTTQDKDEDTRTTTESTDSKSEVDRLASNTSINDTVPAAPNQDVDSQSTQLQQDELTESPQPTTQPSSDPVREQEEILSTFSSNQIQMDQQDQAKLTHSNTDEIIPTLLAGNNDDHRGFKGDDENHGVNQQEDIENVKKRMSQHLHQAFELGDLPLNEQQKLRMHDEQHSQNKEGETYFAKDDESSMKGEAVIGLLHHADTQNEQKLIASNQESTYDARSVEHGSDWTASDTAFGRPEKVTTTSHPTNVADVLLANASPPPGDDIPPVEAGPDLIEQSVSVMSGGASSTTESLSIDADDPKQGQQIKEVLRSTCGMWGSSSYSKPANLSLLYLVFHDEVPHPKNPALLASNQAERITDDAFDQSGIDSTRVKSSSANDEFVQGLDDIDKFFEGVEPPDELDVGAMGSSIQEVLMGSGTRIVIKRVRMGLTLLKRWAMKAKDTIRDQVHEHVLVHFRDDDDSEHAVVGRAAEWVWNVSKEVWTKATHVLDRIFEGDLFAGRDDTEESLDIDISRSVPPAKQT